jgi:hypothetical protein
VTLVFGASIDWLLGLLGAQGEALHLAKLFIWTLMPGFVLLAGAVCCSFILRGLGDPRRAMYITLLAAAITAITDPVFIFGFGWGIQGAAAANVLADLAAFLMGLHGVRNVHDFLGPMRLAGLRRDFRAINAIAFPAMLTQLATPFATPMCAPSPLAMRRLSAIIGRIILLPCIIFRRRRRRPDHRQFRRQGRAGQARLTDGLLFSLAIRRHFTILFLVRHHIADAFSASGRTSISWRSSAPSLRSAGLSPAPSSFQCGIQQSRAAVC